MQEQTREADIDKPYFSIIVPIYKVEKYLDNCISSVLQQSFEKFEIILVDDGSPDTCPLLCDQWAVRDERIRVIHKSNGGLSSARNFGLNMSQGEYVIFLDSDDYWNDQKLLGTAYEFIVRNNGKDDLDVILFQAQKYYEKTDIFVKDKEYNVSIINQLDRDNTIKYLIETETYSMSACTKIIKKEILEKNNISFEEGLLGEDLDWFFSLVFASNNIYAIESLSYIYRIRNGSITHTIGRKNIEDSLYIIKKWSTYINDHLRYSVFRKYYYGILAYAQVINMLNYNRLNVANRKEMKKEIKENCYLLKYCVNKRIRYVYYAFEILGFSFTTKCLYLYSKMLR